jgi:type IV pilus assembly protein PilM
MAKNAGVWGIDIGQCAFKAMRCQLEDGVVVADAFDYIEYPKILSQPEAEPERMIQEALEQFLSRNDVKGCKVALSVPGQSGLAKFFKPPPVAANKIPEIVKYEARQQIPFALEDVIWDFQQMGGGAEVEGFALETEVGLFAMKREQVYRAMEPFRNAGVELDIIQLAPLSIYNFVSYDILGDGKSAEDYDPDNPPPSVVVLSMGTDTTDLVITNGFRVWQRSIPLGGNHFTKQLTKELKLTFAKAEHLKRNARQAEDPKMVFQAMRPVFNDLVTEVQRSIGYFQGIDRKAKIGGVVVLGNAVKLPGLQQYLSKNLGYEVKNFQAFQKLQGPDVLSAPAFKDNQLSFGASYGLCLQGLEQATLRTNLVPREIVTERLVRAKKPWAVATLGALLLACTFNFFFYYGSWRQVSEEREVGGVSWKAASSAVSGAQSKSSSFKSKDDTLVTELKRITAIGEELVGNTDRHLLWLQMLQAVNSALPRTPGLAPGVIPDVETLPFEKRWEVHVEEVENQYFEDLSTWFEPVKKRYIEQNPQPKAGDTAAAGTASVDVTTGATGATSTGTEPTGPTEAGWVVELKCYHYFNADRAYEGIAHVLRKPEEKMDQNGNLLRLPGGLMHNLREGTMVVPVAVHRLLPGVRVRHQAVDPEGKTRVMPLHIEAITPAASAEGADTGNAFDVKLTGVVDPIRLTADQKMPVIFTMEEMGIEYPVIIRSSRIQKEHKVPNPNFDPGDMPGYGSGGMGGMGPGGLGGPGTGGAPGMPGGAGAGPGAGAPGLPGMPGSGSSFGSGSGAAGSGKGKDDEPVEPQYLIVPRYDFTIQFVWKEKMLTERLEAQAKDWESKPTQGTQGPADPGLAVNVKGGGA